MDQAHTVKGPTMKFQSDIDIDFGNRDLALKVLNLTPASISRDEKLVRHNTGVYATDIPVDPFLGIASIDYKTAEDLGYTKLDFLNVSLYTHIKNEQHLVELMAQEPAWDKLYDPEFCAQLIHIGAHYDLLIKCPEAVNTIPRLAMFLALIRPGKRHLVGRTWREIAETVWEPDTNGGYAFKKAHGVAYAHLVAVHMNLLTNLTYQGN
jgi:hypothetical protein